MRQIKFRIWHKKENRWLDPWAEEDPILSLKDFGKGCEVYLYDRNTQEHSNINCQMDDVVIQQYTGLKDKNGVEIYEGDIVEIYLTGPAETSKPNTGKVFWNDEDLCFSLEVEISTGIVEWGFEYTELKVLGNIFEGDNVCPKCNILMRTDTWRQRKGDAGQVRYTCTHCGHTEVNKNEF